MKPLIGITLGDPNGVGPEVVVKALQNKNVSDFCKAFVIGSKDVIFRCLRAMELEVSLVEIKKPEDALCVRGAINVLDSKTGGAEGLRIGKIQPQAGEASVFWLKEGADLARRGKIDALCTAPMSIVAVRRFGLKTFCGQTKYLGDLAGAQNPIHVKLVQNLRIFCMTEKSSLMEAAQKVKYDNVYGYIKGCAEALSTIGLPGGKMAVAALNPGCGELGFFGPEERAEIAPAVKRCKIEGVNVAGPFDAGALFAYAKEGRYDAVLTLYKDQAQIACAALDYYKNCGLTLNLPYVRTSTDKGPQFHLAGKWEAKESGMVEAILKAVFTPKTDLPFSRLKGDATFWGGRKPRHEG